MKFTTPNIVVTNPIPEETRIYYSKSKELVTIVLSILALVFGIYCLTLGIDYLAGALLCFVVGGAFLYFKLKNFTNESPQIILNEKGLQTVNNPFYYWEYITEAGVTKLEMGRSTYYHFTYKTKLDSNEISLRIDNLNISRKNLSLLIRFYIEKNKRPSFTYLDLKDLKDT
ncbi:hypothetical protein FO440_08410 [Mucilaginibacter corticis]|uniref:Uncharacterized protein n=1 Tax=Mucilaginibacter corticis TaxID=2597670 RepID=A0A556MW84_9SPHI|nr:hypothetical protein [Mucilaginibacter corticis]TSJ44181.1 hypothetical protein FO440_08410 [Mucilaginibacter corticis]